MAVQTKGFCKYCGRAFTRGGMLRHLESCKERAIALEAERGKRKAGYFQLVLTGRYRKDYWLIIEMRDSAMLEELDQFIRDIWVECCGHMSCFKIHGKQYEPSRMFGDSWGYRAESMRISLSKVLSPDMEFTYEYDYGSATELAVKVEGYRTGFWKEEAVTILSRNNPPEILCSCCGNNLAEWVDPQGYYDGTPYWCEECLEEQYEDPEEAWILPICNSPRMGVCGYGGSEIYPDQFEPDKKYVVKLKARKRTGTEETVGKKKE